MRRLSDPEFAQFTNDETEFIASLAPEQSAIVDWNGLKVLVYLAADTITVGGNIYPDVYLSDVTDAPQLAAMSNPVFHTPSQTWYEALPDSLIASIQSDAIQAGVLLNGLAQQIGATAGNLTRPLLQNLTPVLVILGLILAAPYLSKGSK